MDGIAPHVRPGGATRAGLLGFRAHVAPVMAPVAVAAIPTRQRAKLWELSDTIHCSIVGTCLTTGELRRVMGKVTPGDTAGLSDHDLHAQAVGLCGQHTTSSKLLQKTLDGRHQTVIKRFAHLQGEAAVMEAWSKARRAGDIPGAYWAVLTHPDVGYAGVRQAFGDVHMLSHLVGAANRADIVRLAALEKENAALSDKVERQQVRLHEAVTSRDTSIGRLSALAAHQVGAATGPAGPDGSDDALRHLVADLQGRLARETGRRERLEGRVAELLSSSQACERRASEAEAERTQLRREIAVLEWHAHAPDPVRAVMDLPAQRILYVGGRPGCTEQMRDYLESAGGTLLCHDGGLHDHVSLLPGLISQADQVAFPVDCVSHDAALTVKRVCRQLNKAWLPLRSSGVSSFLAALSDLAGAGKGHGAVPSDTRRSCAGNKPRRGL